MKPGLAVINKIQFQRNQRKEVMFLKWCFFIKDSSNNANKTTKTRTGITRQNTTLIQLNLSGMSELSKFMFTCMWQYQANIIHI